MSREKKKGTSGNAKAFITRAKALKKLQLSLSEFRRLCILKGIYPRDPRKKLEGSDKTYYLRKDIDFLRHERLISTVRQENAHKKKEVKARAKRRIDVLKRLALSKPKARLDHLVVERYPNFTDAIRELDDPVCVVALFANLPADHKVGIKPERVTNCQRLLKEFHNFVAETNALKRCFVSIKGYYFQARVAGELVTWVTPHRFSQVLPADVDYSVMLTFLELYECILSFVNFRLYTSQNLAYPPKISRVANAKGLELAAIEVERKSSRANGNAPMGLQLDEEVPDQERVSAQAVKKAQQMVMDAGSEDEEDEENEEEKDGNKQSTGSKEANGVQGELSDDDRDVNDVSSARGVFDETLFVLGREVPYTELEFVLKASGAARVTREDDLVEGPNRLEGYTHWIIDRPKIVGRRDMSLEYVQPQYIFDSINAGVALPTSLYSPGNNLPPHLSPFVTEEDDGGYRPWFKDVLDRIKAGDTSVVAEAAAVVYAEGNAKTKGGMDKGGEADLAMSGEQRRAKRKLSRGSQGDEASSMQDPAESHKRNLDENENKFGKNVEKEASGIERVGSGGVTTKQSDGSNNSKPENEGTSVDSMSEEEKSEEESEEEESEEEEEEEEEEAMSKEKESEIAKEGKEMAALMMSRKRMKQYKRHKREEQAKQVVRDRLTAKRKQIESERTPVAEKTRKRRKSKA
ncbi:unnamed protein product [Chondrus crispus]|uniref:Pescadillo homolog n=1 Tax=Chondrus crispus TaxID=2769 RepID=R7QD08_CHOCR|nr:unnamed protein product [Chondrus crispus]CDF35949.1 unnamed protein product [Chondrus crispus]|eukprot:XP_005715768.1 unnamed protein product [Chondrus crispus]